MIFCFKCTIFYYPIRLTAFSSPLFTQNDQSCARRQFLQTATASTAAASTLLFPTIASAEITVPEQSKEYEFPADWGLTYNYDADAARVRSHMVIATGMAKGTERMEDFGKNLKKEMIDFVSYYRRFPQVAGKPSFSTLYTSINVLAGHYTSYGYKYPLPEKRRKRLYQEYAEIDKSLKRSR
ncbi:hypothetical protein ACHAXR_005928 [Thalassiosira sp. AJA248-18]